MPADDYWWSLIEVFPSISDEKLAALEQTAREVIADYEDSFFDPRDPTILESIQEDGFADVHIEQIADVLSTIYELVLDEMEALINASENVLWWTAPGVHGDVGKGIYLTEVGDDYQIFSYRWESTSIENLGSISRAEFDAFSGSMKAKFLIEFATSIRDDEFHNGTWPSGHYDFNWTFLTHEVVDEVFGAIGHKLSNGSYLVRSTAMANAFERMLAARSKSKEDNES